MLTLFYVHANLNAPVQRDGAHFVFMANNIAHGQAPYWASFETKNPLVELYWSPFLFFLSKSFGIVGAARIAESLWLLATAVLMFFIVVQSTNSRVNTALTCIDANIRFFLPAAVVSICYFVLVMDVRVTDDGLNISLYQSLPELLLLAFLLKPPQNNWFLNGLLVATLVFLAWLVKQTSVLPAITLLIASAIIHRRQLTLAWWGGVVVGLAITLGAFALHLTITDTWPNYLLGTYAYKASMIPLGWPALFKNALSAYSVPILALDLPSFLAAHRVWSGIATLVLSAWAVLRLISTPNEVWSVQRVALTLSIFWMITAWIQAVAGLTFFSHYFLASIAPVFVSLGLLLTSSPKKIVLPISVTLLITAAILIAKYSSMDSSNELRREQAPITRATSEVLRLLRPEDRIFNWNGLPHILIAHGAPSAYPMNMYWPYIMTGLPEETRKKLLKETLQVPPDVVIAIVEQYPPNQALRPENMTTGRLYELTQQAYRLEYETTPMEGRYGNAVQVFRRQ